jgi:hypothetical protein
VISLQRIAAQLHRETGNWPSSVWDVRLDPYYRELLARVAGVPKTNSELDWLEIDELNRLRISRAMLDAFRVGRAISSRVIP